MICATKHKSIIYLCAFDTDDSTHRRESATERDKVMSSWGYKFEQYMVSGKFYIIKCFINYLLI